MKWRLDIRSFNQNVRHCEVAWKKSFGALTGFRPVASAFALQCSSSWGMKVFYQLWADYSNLHFKNKLKVYLTNKCYPVSEWVCFCIVSAVVTWVSERGRGQGGGEEWGTGECKRRQGRRKPPPFSSPPPPKEGLILRLFVLRVNRSSFWYWRWMESFPHISQLLATFLMLQTLMSSEI